MGVNGDFQNGNGPHGGPSRNSAQKYKHVAGRLSLLKTLLSRGYIRVWHKPKRPPPLDVFI